MENLNCSRCGNPLQTLVTTMGGQPFTLPICSFCSEERDAKDAADKLAEFEEWKARAKSDVIPKIFQDFTMSEYSINENNRGAVSAAKALFDGKINMLTLTGDTGRGKTALAIAVIHAVIESNTVDMKLHQRVRPVFLRSVDFFEGIKKSWNTGEDYLGEIRVKKFLVLDDLMISGKEDWQVQNIYNLVDYRHIHVLRTIITTNLCAKNLEKVYGRRIISRLEGAGEIREVSGEDRRHKRGK